MVETRQHEMSLLQDRLAQLESDSGKEDLVAQMDAHTARTAQLEQSMAQLESQLQIAKSENDQLQSQLSHIDSSSNETISALQSRLASTEAEIATLTDTIAAQNSEISSLRKETDQVRADLKKEAETRLSEKESSLREIRTLRMLGRQGEAEVENQKAEKSKLLEEKSRLEQSLQEVQSKSKANITELLDTLQLQERRTAELEQQVLELEAARSSSWLSEETAQRLKELETAVETKSLEVEEADEKVFEVLKNQKKQNQQIERLKGKIESLTRDLQVAKLAVANVTIQAQHPQVAVPLPEVPQPVTTTKKRSAPTEFDPTPATTPRPLVAISSRTPKEKENIPLKPKSITKIRQTDGLVPLKPAADTPPSSNREARVAFGVVGMNGVNDGGMSKLASLQARLARQQGVANV